MKSFVRSLIPRPLLDRYRKARRLRQQQFNQGKSPEEVFTAIYENNIWGGSRGELCSGDGTRDQHVTAPYVALLQQQAAEHGFADKAFVDLGCGDFTVGRQLVPLCARYTGVDVVSALLAQNRQRYGSPTTQFVQLDITRDALPPGDVCFIRQVLQHLSNAQIASVLKKLSQYRWVYITEHHPVDSPDVRPNLDMQCGSDIRVYDNSGIYLTEAPFSLPKEQVELLLEVPAPISERQPAVIRTFLYQPRLEFGLR